MRIELPSMSERGEERRLLESLLTPLGTELSPRACSAIVAGEVPAFDGCLCLEIQIEGAAILKLANPAPSAAAAGIRLACLFGALERKLIGGGVRLLGASRFGVGDRPVRIEFLDGEGLRIPESELVADLALPRPGGQRRFTAAGGIHVLPASFGAEFVVSLRLAGGAEGVLALVSLEGSWITLSLDCPAEVSCKLEKLMKEREIFGAMVPLSLRLGRLELTLGQIVQLRVGDEIQIELDREVTAELCLDGKPVALVLADALGPSLHLTVRELVLQKSTEAPGNFSSGQAIMNRDD